MGSGVRGISDGPIVFLESSPETHRSPLITPHIGDSPGMDAESWWPRSGGKGVGGGGPARSVKKYVCSASVGPIMNTLGRKQTTAPLVFTQADSQTRGLEAGTVRLGVKPTHPDLIML